MMLDRAITTKRGAGVAGRDVDDVDDVGFIDIETRSPLDLRESGEHVYVADPRTQVLCVCYAIGDGPVRVWRPSDSTPLTITAVPKWVAHGAAFERAIVKYILGPRFGWPEIRLGRWHCTMAAAVAQALPASLATLSEALKLTHGKDAAGSRLMLQMAKPRRPRSDEDPAAILYFDDEERLARLIQYCARDVEATREVFYTVPALPPEEEILWRLDQRINDRGVPIDRALTMAARDIAAQARPELDHQLAELTGGVVDRVNQVARMKAWLEEHGCPLESLSKETVEQALYTELSEPVRRVLECRRDGAKNSVAKFEKILAGLDPDDRLRGLFRYHAASTGRWSSTRTQVHNLRRITIKDPEPVIAAVLSGDLERVRALGAPPLVTLSNIPRAMICAPPGRMLLGADFSAVESRDLAWHANEPRKLKAYRDFDATHDPRLEPYLTTACMLFNKPNGTFGPESPERRLGKTADLAFGYQGGVRAWRAFEPDPRNPLPDPQVEKFKDAWRAAHPNVVRFWYALEDAAIAAVHRPGQVARCGRVAFKLIEGALYLRLPSGRLLAFPDARIEHNRDGRKRVVFMDNANGNWLKDSLYGGKLCENVVSATARDLLSAAIARVDAAGFEICLHVHDELVVEVPEGPVDLAGFTKLMTELPSWAQGLPLAAKAWTGRRYVKS
jgi:DNA polymerase bacteriophage-type